jgi:hypothetical protein
VGSAMINCKIASNGVSPPPSVPMSLPSLLAGTVEGLEMGCHNYIKSLFGDRVGVG